MEVCLVREPGTMFSFENVRCLLISSLMFVRHLQPRSMTEGLSVPVSCAPGAAQASKCPI